MASNTFDINLVVFLNLSESAQPIEMKIFNTMLGI